MDANPLLFSQPEERIFQVIFLVVVTVVCLIGNGLLIIVIITQPPLRKPCNVYLACLATTDLGFSLCHILCIYSTIENAWPLSQTMCVVQTTLLISFSILSLCHITIIALNRYIYVCFQTTLHMLLTFKATWIFEGLTVLLGVVCAVLPGFFMAESEFDSRIRSCIIATHQPGQWVYPLYLGVLLMLIPVGTSLFCYYKIYKKVKEIKENLCKDSNLEDKEKKAIVRRQLQGLITRVLVFLSFFLMYIPFLITRILDSLVYIPDSIHLACALLCCSNSMVNPIIYGVTKKNFGNGYKNIISKIFCCRKYNRRLNESTVGYSVTSGGKQNQPSDEREIISNIEIKTEQVVNHNEYSMSYKDIDEVKASYLSDLNNLNFGSKKEFKVQKAEIEIIRNCLSTKIQVSRKSISKVTPVNPCLSLLRTHSQESMHYQTTHFDNANPSTSSA